MLLGIVLMGAKAFLSDLDAWVPKIPGTGVDAVVERLPGGNSGRRPGLAGVRQAGPSSV
jgi:hypothetical protein